MNDTTFQAKLLSVMKDNQFDRFVSNLKNGKLDTKKLYKISRSDKLFKKKRERLGKNYHVELLVDCSGSMSYSRDTYAVEVAQKLANALDKVGVSLKIVGFNCLVHTIKDFHEKTPSNKDLENTILHMIREEHRIYLCKDCRVLYPQKDKKMHAKHKYHNTTKSADIMGNCDGEPVYFARKELAKRTGGKIIIILSDGNPRFDDGMNWWSYQNPKMKYQDYDLKAEVQKAINEGIIFIGVGLQTSSVERYYPEKNTIISDNLEDLYGSISKMLSKLITRG